MPQKERMAKNLVIVESPAKAKTIERFLGKDFKVASSFGHIVDLPANKIGVDVDKNFTPDYIISSDKKKVVSELKGLAKKADLVWLASDEDREGEAIAWHLANSLGLSEEKSKRIVFSEITKTAITKAIQNPRTINLGLVNAQQARRVLDRLVGYELSPVLWKKVKAGLSAGRVQSVAVRLIVERERAIHGFKIESLYKTQALFKTAGQKEISAQLLKSLKTADEAKSFLETSKQSAFQVDAVENKPAKKTPAPPFTTSTLQQEASRKLYFSVSRTMSLAQRLYEAGLITYMRTDSVNLSQEALDGLTAKIESLYGTKYVKRRAYKSKNKSAQEAHEAIRPTDPSKATITADPDQVKLYELIWKRTIACQMSDAQLERTQIEISANNHSDKFVAKGEVITFDGFLKVYIEGVDDEDSEVSDLLPKVGVGENLSLDSMTATERFTRPPYRFTEASLVKKLEELGIGRPSTYAPTISTIQNRNYVLKGTSEGEERLYKQLVLKEDAIKEYELQEKAGANKGKLIPTDIGMIVNDFLVANFEGILDFNFTAQVEQDFDDIARGNLEWTKMLKTFYGEFHKTVKDVEENAERESGERELGKDPKTGKIVKVRLGRFGPMAQIGNVDDDEKPSFASLNPGQQLETITFKEALQLFELPRTIGTYKDKEVIVNNGRYGPYVKYEKIFVSLPKKANPMEVDLDTAITLIQEKEKANQPIHTYKSLPVTKGVGRFGPFLKWNEIFINVNKSYDFDNLSVDNIVALIEDKIQKEKDKIIHDWKEEGIRVEKARWGRVNVIKGKKKIQLPKETDALKLTVKQAAAYFESEKKSTRKKATLKK